MSHTHDLDNEEPLFQFDSYDVPVDVTSNPTHPDLVDVTHNISPFALSSPAVLDHTLDQTIAREMDGQDVSVVPEDGKGKGVSKPMPIRLQIDSMRDNFDMGSSTGGYVSQPGTSYAHSPPLTSSSFDLQSIETPLDDIYQRLMIPGQENPVPIPGSFDDESQVASASFLDKGKAKDLAPTLPPLQFSPTEFGYSKADWPSPELIAPTPGPSSYGSGYGTVIESNINLTLAPDNDALSQSVIRRMPSRRRSFSNLSIHSTRSMAALSMSRVKVKFGTSKGPGNLARKLLFRSRPGSSASSPPTPGTITPGGNVFDREFAVGQGNCLMPWRNDYKSQARDVPPVPYLNLEAKLDQQTLPVYCRSQKAVDLKAKGRSYSSPLPLSALDIIPSVLTDVFTPIPIIPRNYFDEMLPRELRLRVLTSLVALHEAEHDRAVKEGDWTVMRASKNRWVGKDKAIRELVKFSRISKSWQALVFDGQMWSNLNLRAFPRIPPSLLTRLSRAAGTFIKTIDVSGHASLLPSTLIDVTDELCLRPVPNGQLPFTQLTTINFQGCAALTTKSLHHLIIRSPSLHTICLKGLTAVTNTTCDVIGTYCAQLSSLDIGRCINVDGEGLRRLITASTNREDISPLKELRISGMKRLDDDVLATLGMGAPLLEVLDLSYIRDLHNSALEAFVSCSDDDDTQFETVLLTSREAGRDQTDSTNYRRRVTRLRHLSLSSCVLLTDNACSNLAHTVPYLELLEMGSIGPDLRDDGLVRLLKTTPFIRKLDLEDAAEITDTVIAAITPGSAAVTRNSRLCDTPEPGHALEHLSVSYAANLSDEAFLSLIQNCSRLSVLEADNTRISGAVLKEFVRRSRNRKLVDAVAVVIDCRGVGESLVKELSASTRPRKGWRSYEARKLGYVDGRDKEDLKVGRDECDEKRVVLKSFYSWQTVDAVRAVREKRRKAKRAANASGGNTSDSDDVFSGRARWWSPGGRRSSGNTSPTVLDVNGDRDQCRIA
ncbi:hypothetical protein PILCRDRAFT_822981 [Piloderma croceum F 1598]|uniref:F-box domain-containing protein n=1 Tax=Piloderma croceum (strain F 1598) TaxID=765440 RepID=A0A0C3F520_PILCF|nr:hypothetical protein PILCRDRAFT_822981 [Piloderma croceum F 1598]